MHGVMYKVCSAPLSVFAQGTYCDWRREHDVQKRADGRLIRSGVDTKPHAEEKLEVGVLQPS